MKFSGRLRSSSLILVGILAGTSLSLALNAVAQRTGKTALPLEDLERFSIVYETIKKNYVEEVSDKELIESAISGMLSGLDPHSSYLNADAFSELQNQTQGEFGGLGIEVSTEDGFVKVIAPIEDTPAARAGVRAGDLIIKIDDKATKGLSLTDAVKLMRGKPQTPIRITVLRKGVDKPIEIKIVRDIIKVKSVRSKMLENNIAYIRITQFQEKTSNDLVQHILDLGAKSVPKGLVLDLRNDPGGLLTGAIGVSGVFLAPGVDITSTDGRARGTKRTYKAVPSDYGRGFEEAMSKVPDWVKSVPMVVLTNGGSASASEIVAGALQDYARAKIIGTRTFGKGSVQVILPIGSEPQAGLKLTTSRYYTPKGRSIQATGIVPDYIVTDTPEGDLYERPREADLDGHLSNNRSTEEEKKSSYSDPAKAAAIERSTAKPIEFGSPEDYQLQQAIRFLQGKPVQVSKEEKVAPAKPETATKKAPEKK